MCIGEVYKIMKFRIFKYLNIMLLILMFCNTASAVNFYKKDDISTDSVVLYNTDLDKEVFSKNADKKRSMASTTKIMTYIIVAENVADLDNTNIVVSKEIFGNLENDVAMADLKDGDVLTVNQLLNCLMVPSGGDAALVLANYVGGGSVEKFVEMMNNKAQELGCTNTHFSNPHGLYDEQHYSTANDMYKITKYAIKQQRFMDICSKSESAVFSDDRKPLITTNKMIDKVRGRKYYYEYARGIKTGYLDEAGYCLISTASKEGTTYMCVALGAPSFDSDGNKIEDNMAMLDSKKLYEWAFSSLKLKPLADAKKMLGQTGLNLAWKKDNLLLFPEKSVYTILPTDFDMSSIKLELNVPESLDAPVETGDLIGNAVFMYEGEKLAEINVVSGETVPKSWFLLIVRTIKNILFSKVFLTCFTLFLIMSVWYVVVTIKKNMNRKNRKRRNTKKYNDRPKHQKHR